MIQLEIQNFYPGAFPSVTRKAISHSNSGSLLLWLINAAIGDFGLKMLIHELLELPNLAQVGDHSIRKFCCRSSPTQITR